MLPYINRQLLGNSHLFVLVIVLLLLGGLAALSSLPKQEDPRLTNRFPVILVSWPGVAPKLLESLVIEPLEREIREESAVNIIESTATTGLARIAIELGDWVKLDEVPRINGRLRDATATVPMPAEISSFRFIDDRDPVAYSSIISLRWDDVVFEHPPEIGGLSRAARILADRIQALASSDKVDISGDRTEEWIVSLNDQHLAALGIGLPEVILALQQADVRVAAGAIDEPAGQVTVQVAGAFSDRERIGAVPVLNADGRSVVIADLGEVNRGWSDPAISLSRVNGHSAILVSAQLQEGGQLSTWAGQVDRIRDEFAQEYLGSVVVEQIFDQRHYVEPRLQSLAMNLFLGVMVIMAVIVILMGWRSALVVGVALPLTIGGLFMVLAVLGVPLHQMSLFGLIIALGLLIDNAIVVVDEVAHQRRLGHGTTQAVLQTGKHLGAPLLASTLTTVASFTPIMLLPGPAGEFIGTIAVSVNVSLLISLVLSLTVIACWSSKWTPMVQQSRRWWRSGVESPLIQSTSAKSLTWLLQRPFASLLLVLSISLLGLFQARHLGGQFFPAADRDVFQVRVWLPSGSAIDQTEATVLELDEIISQTEGVTASWWHVGGSFPSVYYNQIADVDEQPFYAQGIITAQDPQTAYDLVPVLQNSLTRAVPQAQVVVSEFGQGPPVVAPVAFRLVGPDLGPVNTYDVIFQLLMRRK